jgi:adenylylsulfate kinase
MTVVALVSPYAIDRQAAREIIGSDRFFEVHIDAPVETCESRDTDGLYAAARKGEIKGFTGISAPYEAPGKPDLHIDSSHTPVDQSVQSIIDLLQAREILS